MSAKQKGFSLVELLVVLAVFIFVIAAATGILIPMIGQFKQQSKIAETNIEGIIGLELLRGDLEQAGFGLPWSFPDDTINYTEAAGSPANKYNDSNSADKIPRAFVVGNDVSDAGVVGGSDYLVIKATTVAKSDTAHKWTTIVAESDGRPRTWVSPDTSENLLGTDKVIVIKPKVGDTRLRELAMDGSTFFTTYSSSFPVNFSPTKPTEAYLIYGVDPTTNLKMPFNRVDYYVSTARVPARCATGTGVLTKAVLTHRSGVDFPAQNVTPLLDCVADMQVIFGLDLGSPGGGTDPNGIIGTYTNSDGSTFTGGAAENEVKSQTLVQETLKSAKELRNRLMEIRVYILAHEGQKDLAYTFNNFTCGANCVAVGDFGCGRDFNFSTSGITDWKSFRWKVYTLVVKPQNLR
jgi:prepilin-type N-terminal cleavage/methylation domain-containing protein